MDYKTSCRLSSHQAADCLASNVKVSARTLINHSAAAAAAHKQREVGGLRGGGKGKKKKKEETGACRGNVRTCESDRYGAARGGDERCEQVCRKRV